MATTTASRKAKGRNLQKDIVSKILETFPNLTRDDVSSRSMGASGTDVLLSTEALRVFPFAVEAKAQEALNIWSALEQAATESRYGIPLLIFKRNRSDTYACLEINDFFDLIKPIEETNDKTTT